MSKLPKVDPGKCIGCGTCAAICSNVFRMNDENKAEAYNPAGDTEENIQQAISSCPVQAIAWEE